MSELVEKIAEEIKKRGVIPFARFMELALYCPVYGYYEKETDRLGRRGDYFTSVSVGSLFGELLACQFAEWVDNGPHSPVPGPGCTVRGSSFEIQSPKSKVQSSSSISYEQGAKVGKTQKAQLVEAGAHRGALAKDILGWMRAQRPALFERLEYWIVEPSERRRQWQQEFLAEFGDRIRWATHLSDLATTPRSFAPRSEAETEPRLPRESPAPAGGTPHSALRTPHSDGVKGIIFSNELLDALPVHRLGWDAKERVWFEWGVTMRGGQFVWTKGLEVTSSQSTLHRRSFLGAERSRPQSSVERSTTAAAFDALKDLSLPGDLLEALPDGFTLEVCPLAVAWWREAARVLSRGKLLTIDYGLSTQEWLTPERRQGTLRAYYQHRVSSDLLAKPGQQDLTAHINFSAIQAAGELAGLRTEHFLTQSQFLTRIAGRIWNRGLDFSEWNAQRTRQFQTLTHPEHLGHAFRVLVQSRL